jgi:hypothetical protein
MVVSPERNSEKTRMTFLFRQTFAVDTAIN